MRGDEAKKICSDLELVRVPVVRGKADLSKYRNAGKAVASVLQTFTPLMTRASVDEAYLDLTECVNNRLIDMEKVKEERNIRAIFDFLVIFFNDFRYRRANMRWKKRHWKAHMSLDMKI